MGRAEFQWNIWFERMSVYELLNYETERLWASGLVSRSLNTSAIISLMIEKSKQVNDDDRIDTETHTVRLP